MTAVDVDALAAAVPSGSRRALARAITLIESTRADHRDAAVDLIARLQPHAGRSIRIGITGTPGVGKSTFIEALGNHVADAGHRIAVLAVDPSSAVSGGSILGDKTRMELLARRPEAFIRPSPSGGTLGGVARRTREAILACEAAGYDAVVVETVGVGQSETAVADMTDLFMLLLAPAGGDELQGIKRGIMELADLVVVNKADGELRAAALRTAGDYGNALRLLRPKTSAWRTEVLTCSALDGTGIADVWDAVGRYRSACTDAGVLAARRAEQGCTWMWTEMTEGLLERFRDDPAVRARLPEVEGEVRAGRLPPGAAARELLALVLGRERR